jgi:hypothetical protein
VLCSVCATLCSVQPEVQGNTPLGRLPHFPVGLPAQMATDGPHCMLTLQPQQQVLSCSALFPFPTSRSAQPKVQGDTPLRRLLHSPMDQPKQMAYAALRCTLTATTTSAAMLCSVPFLPFHAVHNPKFKATHPLEDCPTPLWVSHSRWRMLHLAAH